MINNTGVKGANVDIPKVIGGGRFHDIAFAGTSSIRPVSLPKDSGMVWTDPNGYPIAQHHERYIHCYHIWPITIFRYPGDAVNPSPSDTRSLATPYTRLCTLYDGLCPTSWQETLKEVHKTQPKNPCIAQRDIARHQFIIVGQERPQTIPDHGSTKAKFIVEKN